MQILRPLRGVCADLAVLDAVPLRTDALLGRGSAALACVLLCSRVMKSGGVNSSGMKRSGRTSLGPEEERDLARRSGQGDAAAFGRIVDAHIPLVHSIASEFRTFGLPPEELVSEGLLGLVKAVRSFDPERGVRLSTYAVWWIRAYVRRYTIENRRIVRGPSTRNARKVMAGLSKTERRLTQLHGEAPGPEAIASVLGVAPSDVEEARAVLRARDVPCDVQAGGRPFQFASDALSPEAIVTEKDERRVSRERVHSALACLAPRARRILERRYLEDEASTFAELGRELGISRERVRQIEMEAKARVRSALCA